MKSSAILIVVVLIGCGPGMNYPYTKKVEVVDEYHGTKVPDPFRWLEETDSPDVTAWLEAQNKITFGYLRPIPAREKIKARLTELWNFPRTSAPRREGGRYFYSKNDGLQNQAVVYMQKLPEGPPVAVIDPNTMSADGTVAVTQTAPSHDGALLAYVVSQKGSDWQDIRVRETDTLKDRPDHIRWCKFTGVAWKHNGEGFFYSRYPEPGTVKPEEQYFNHRVYWHKLGTPQSEDRVVYERPDARELGFSPWITDDGKVLVLYVWHGTDSKNRIYWREVEGTGDFVRMLDRADANYSPIGNVGTTFFFRTDLDAPRGRVVAIDLHNSDRRHWKEIIPQQDVVIVSVAMIHQHLVVLVSRDAHHEIRIYGLDGTFVRALELPAIGSVSDITGKPEDDEMFISFTSFLHPPGVFRYDFKTQRVSAYHTPKLTFDPSRFETRQVFFTSKDGTRIPMFVTHLKGLSLDGRNPVLLYGYGGFDISVTPYFSLGALVWMEHGGVFAVANLRGGGEYGEEWHQAGMFERKQNVFDDFIAAAEWLVKNNYTRPARLAIMGGSNGGLLVGACMTQRPDLYGAVVCQVPVLDMLRYHKYTVGRYWTVEYGNAEERPDHFKFLYAYSPLHNVKKGVAYPATLIATADHDDRVDPAHARKFAAALQESQVGAAPILLRVETKAGHGMGKPTSKLIDEISDVYAFLFDRLGVNRP